MQNYWKCSKSRLLNLGRVDFADLLKCLWRIVGKLITKNKKYTLESTKLLNFELQL